MILTPLNVFGMTICGLEYGDVECWVDVRARHRFEVLCTLLASIVLILWYREMIGELSSVTDSLNASRITFKICH